MKRREFLASAAGVGVASTLGTVLSTIAQTAEAQVVNSTDYRALVCLYMAGGNDTHNTFLATDNLTWQQYEFARGQIALNKEQLITVSDKNRRSFNTGRNFGLHPSFKNLSKLWEDGDAAVVSNVGPLIEPLTKSNIATSRKPPFLYSHNHQTWTWQKLNVARESEGWGGRLAEYLNSNTGNSDFANLSTMRLVGNTWDASKNVRPFQIIENLGHSLRAFSDSDLSASQKSLLRELQAMSGSSLMRQDWTSLVQGSISLHEQLRSQLTSVEALPNINAGEMNLTDISVGYVRNFRSLLQGIIAGRSLGLKRQVFIVGGPGGFDSHFGVLGLNNHYLKMDDAFGYFYEALKSRNLLNSVTLFTASEFGRTLKSNGDGSDHGWGGHHFVIGGAVNGGEVYGRFPNVGLGTEDDHVSGSLIPSISVEQYAAPLCKWMGLTDSQINDLFPNLRNFSSTALADLMS